MLTGAKKSSPFPSLLLTLPLLGMGSFSQTEVDVAKILRSLPKLIRRSQTQRRANNSCNVDWGVKKRRSGTASASSNRKHCNLPFSTSAPLPSKVAALSPASPLLFYPSGGEETDAKPTVASSSSVSPSFRPSKKAKVRNKEWIREQNDNLSTLFELNKNLQKEAEEMRSRHESLFAENTRLKEIKSKFYTRWEIVQKRITREERQQQKEAAIVLPEEKHTISPTPAGPTTAKVQQEPTSLTTTQTQTEVPIAPPQHRQFQYNHHHHQIHFSSSRSLTLSASNIDSHGALEIPDLNAHVDENGFVLADQQKQNFQPPPPPLKQQQVVVVVEQRHWIGQPNLKKAATAEARKKRIEINRRKAAIAAAGAGGAALRGGNRVGLAVER